MDQFEHLGAFRVSCPAGCEPIHPVSRRPSSSAYLEEFSGVAALLLLVEKCEESEVSELRSGVTNAASHRKGYVSSRISLMPGSDWACMFVEIKNKTQDAAGLARAVARKNTG